MTLERKISKVFKLDDETWIRHANPWSCWTRFTVLPILALAFWSRIWLGWFSIIPIMVGLIWMYINPRIFPKPKSTKTWMSKGVFGERVWLNRDKISVPKHHRIAPNILNVISAIGLLLAIWGTYWFDIWTVIVGIALTYLAKLWFMDRMVWLYEDMKHLPEYKKWLY